MSVFTNPSTGPPRLTDEYDERAEMAARMTTVYREVV